MYCNELQELPQLPQDQPQQEEHRASYATPWTVDHHNQPQHLEPYAAANGHYGLDPMVDFSNPGDIFQFEKSFFPETPNGNGNNNSSSSSHPQEFHSMPQPMDFPQHQSSSSSSEAFYPASSQIPNQTESSWKYEEAVQVHQPDLRVLPATASKSSMMLQTTNGGAPL